MGLNAYLAGGEFAEASRVSPHMRGGDAIGVC
jgi:hypothetical protein